MAAVLVVVGFVLWLFLSARPTGPRNGDVSKVQFEPAEVTTARLELVEGVQQLETSAAAPEFEVDEDYIARLEAAEQKAQWIVSQLGNAARLEDRDRLEALQRELGSYIAADLFEQSTLAENRYRAAMLAGDEPAAVEALEQAVDSQRKINRDYNRARQASPSREQMLARDLERLRAAPLLSRLKTDLDAVRQQMAEGEFETARSGLASVSELLLDLADSSPAVSRELSAERATVKHLETEVAAREMRTCADRMRAEAVQLAAAGDYEQAGARLGDAIAKLRAVNVNFPSSSVADPQALEELERDRQTTLSQPMAKRFNEALANLDTALHTRRELAAADALGIAFSIMETLREQYPRNRHVTPETELRLRFLNSLRGDLGALQDAVLDHLQPVPSHPGWAMLDREVSQLLFSKLTGSNPSSERADMLPVEGVTLLEANDFAQRLSWLLGREVRIPGRKEFLAALQPVDPAQVRAGAWHSATVSNRQPQPVGSSQANARGFYDLLGNVSEWVIPADAGSTEALVAGGSVRDNPIALTKIPMESRPAVERVRYNGFRIMVNLGN